MDRSPQPSSSPPITSNLSSTFHPLFFLNSTWIHPFLSMSIATVSVHILASLTWTTPYSHKLSLSTTLNPLHTILHAVTEMSFQKCKFSLLIFLLKTCQWLLTVLKLKPTFLIIICSELLDLAVPLFILISYLITLPSFYTLWVFQSLLCECLYTHEIICWNLIPSMGEFGYGKFGGD